MAERPATQEDWDNLRRDVGECRTGGCGGGGRDGCVWGGLVGCRCTRSAALSLLAGLRTGRS